MARRLALAASAVLVLLGARAAVEAQPAGKVFTLGFLNPHAPPPPEQRRKNLFVDKLSELGWIPGQNLVLKGAHATGRKERLPELAEELVRRRVDLIYALGPAAAVAAARATKTIPVVFWGINNPVELGLVDSLARPGRNVTGMAWLPGPELVGKELEFLKQIAPAATRLAWIRNPDAQLTVSGAEYTPPIAVESPARSLGFELRIYTVDRREDFDAVFAAAVAWRAHAIGLAGTPLTWRERTRIVEFANQNRLASTFGMSV